LDIILQASSQPIWVFSIFLIVLVILHYVWVFKYQLSMKQWKLVEYIWVVLALMSVIGIVEDARFFRAQMTVEQSEAEAMKKIMALENWFDVYGEYACVDHSNDPDFSGLCGWVKAKNSDLQLILQNETFPVDIPKDFLSGIENPYTGFSDADRDVVGNLHSGYQDALKSYVTSVQEGQRSMLSALIVALAPLLFAVAIAIKFTKVTGEYRLTK